MPSAEPRRSRARPRPVFASFSPTSAKIKRGDTDTELMLRALEHLSGRPGAAPRLLLWPEGVVRDFIEDGYPWRYYTAPDVLRGFVLHDPRRVRARLARLLGPRDLLLAGGSALQFTPDGEVSTASNTIFAIDPRARIVGRYDKAHLVPYGEYLPMRPLLSALGLSRLVPGDLDFQPGPGPRTLALPGFGDGAMQLCYEIVFSGEVVDRAHRPAFLFNPSTTPGSAGGVRRSTSRRRGCARSRKGCPCCARRRPASRR